MPTLRLGILYFNQYVVVFKASTCPHSPIPEYETIGHVLSFFLLNFTSLQIWGAGMCLLFEVMAMKKKHQSIELDLDRPSSIMVARNIFSRDCNTSNLYSSLATRVYCSRAKSRRVGTKEMIRDAVGTKKMIRMVKTHSNATTRSLCK